jgi:hypothetical protein
MSAPGYFAKHTGFGQADRAHGNADERRDAMAVHHCANCDYLDYNLRQSLWGIPSAHAFDGNAQPCMRPGGGAHGASHEEARTRQNDFDDMLLRSQSMSGSNARSQRSQQLRKSGGTEDTRHEGRPRDHKSDVGAILRHPGQEKR